MIVTMAPNVEGHQIAVYLGIVVGEATLRANMFRDGSTGIRSIVGGRSGAYEAALSEAVEVALRELGERAAQRGATAAVGIDLDYYVVTTC
jgi:uncharacterized protein YbjQ (UPF0145 family)